MSRSNHSFGAVVLAVAALLLGLAAIPAEAGAQSSSPAIQPSDFAPAPPFLPSPQPAQQGGAPSPAPQHAKPPDPPPSLPVMESLLVSRMHGVNQIEIRAGFLAAAQASTPAMREFGHRLELDHALADKRLMAYARSHNLQVMRPGEIQRKMQQMQASLPEAETEPQQLLQQGLSPQGSVPPAQAFQQQRAIAESTIRRLQGLHGNAFDAGFTAFLMYGHRRAIAMLSLAQGMLPKGNGLRSMIEGMLPILEQHYDIASRLEIAAIRRRNAAIGARMKTTLAKGGE